MSSKTEMVSVKIERGILERIKSHCKEKRLVIGGFVTDTLTAHMDKVDKRKQSLKK